MAYIIKNKYLKALITNYTKFDDGLKINGFTHGKGVGTAVLTYLVKCSFNIHRFPMWEDRHFTNEFYKYNAFYELEKIFNHKEFLENFDAMINEIRELYKYTQNLLDEKYVEDNVTLIRNISHDYAAVLLQLKNNAINKNEEFIEISTDILNSFTDNPNTYYKDAHIEINVPKKYILYFDEVFDRDIMESEEFVVFNTNSTGLLKIPVNSIFKTNNSFNEYGYNIKVNMNNRIYHFVDFSANNYVKFEKPFKKIELKKENLICKIVNNICKKLL